MVGHRTVESASFQRAAAEGPAGALVGDGSGSVGETSIELTRPDETSTELTRPDETSTELTGAGGSRGDAPLRAPLSPERSGMARPSVVPSVSTTLPTTTLSAVGIRKFFGSVWRDSARRSARRGGGGGDGLTSVFGSIEGTCSRRRVFGSRPIGSRRAAEAAS